MNKGSCPHGAPPCEPCIAEAALVWETVKRLFPHFEEALKRPLDPSKYVKRRAAGKEGR